MGQIIAIFESVALNAKLWIQSVKVKRFIDRISAAFGRTKFNW
jgi:hypothetical protein